MGQPTIYFLCNDVTAPTGGIKIMYRMVDVLNDNGFNAFILHQKSGFRCTWFENATQVKAATETQIQPSDYVVIPEVYLPQLAHAAGNVKKVIFNMNCYYTFLQGYTFKKDNLPGYYTNSDICAVLVLSDDSREYLQYAFPHLNVVKVHSGIDHTLFAYGEHKKNIIAFMPRKHKEDSLQVINILKMRNVLGDFDIVPINKRSEKEVARIMRESLIFLSFGYPEGFGLPPAEAMACGCIVIGYHGMGGREFFKPAFSYPIVEGDIIAFSRTVEDIIIQWKDAPQALNEKRRRASRYIHENYSLAQEKHDIISFWQTMTCPSATHAP